MRSVSPFVVAIAVIAAACRTFGTAGGEEGGQDGGSDPAIPRDLAVAVEWPESPALDPSTDPRAASLRVVVRDASDAARAAERSAGKSERGPFAFAAFTTTPRVDAVVELTGADGRLLGYGEARGWDLERDTTVTVAIRRRLLYLANVDRDPDQLRVVDLAPADRAEPGMTDGPPELDTLAAPTALYVTRDGRLLVEAGASPAGGGAIAVFATSTHARARVVDLPFVPAAIAPIGDGHELVAFPSAAAGGTALARVDVLTGAVTSAPSGLQGGSLSVESAASSADGSRAFAAASYRASPEGPTKAYLLSFDPSTNTAAAIPVPDAEVASAVRFTHDRTNVAVAAYVRTGSGDESTGSIHFFDAASPGAPLRRIDLAPNRSRPTSIVLSPDGKRLFLSKAQLYPGACCAELDVLDPATGAPRASFPVTQTGPEYQLEAAVRLPYAPRRVIAGQSDPGNNVHGPLVELGDDDRPAEIDTDIGGVGTVRAMASPFAEPL